MSETDKPNSGGLVLAGRSDLAAAVSASPLVLRGIADAAKLRTLPRTVLAPYIGIDFGTSNSVVANFWNGKSEVISNRQGDKSTPSVVTLRHDGSLAFGQEAKENFNESRSIRSIKRILGAGERVPFVGELLRTEQIAVMLFSLLKRDTEEAIKQRFTKCVVTIPANSNGIARHATKLCAGAAGFQVLALLTTPIAAAFGYGIDAAKDQKILVYDFGSSMVNVTILQTHQGMFEELCSKCIANLGGDNLDEVLGRYVARRFQEWAGVDVLNLPARTQFMLGIEKAKVELSNQATAVVRIAHPLPSCRLRLAEEIDRRTFEREIMPLIVRSGEAIDEAMHLLGLILQR